MANKMEGNKETEIRVLAFCDICKEDDKDEEAVGLCTKCDQHLCTQCKHYHQRVAATRTHTILGIGELPAKSDESDEKKVPDEVKPLTCNDHKDAILKFYCNLHEKAICATCKLLDHRKCRNVSLSTYIRTDASDQCAGLLEYANAIRECFEKVNSEQIIQNQTLIDEKNKMMEQIKQKRKELDLLEQKAIKEVETIFDEESKDIRQEVETIELSQLLVLATITKLENAVTMGTAEEKFLEGNSASAEIRKYEEILQETKKTSKRQMTFTENEQFSKIDSFGETTLKKEEIEIETCPEVGDKATLTATTSDTEDCMITSMEVLTDGKQLFLDFYNKKLKLYSANNVFLYELALPSKAASMVLLNESHVLLTIPNRNQHSLLKIKIDGETLRFDMCLPTSMQQWLAIKYSDSSFLTLATSGASQWWMQILDHKGYINKSSKVDIAAGLLKIPFDIALSSDCKTAYILDFRNGCFGASLDGEIVFHYKDDYHDGYMGQVIGDDRYIYIGYVIGKENLETGNIVTLSADGKQVKSLCHTDKYMVIPLRCVGNKMVVCTHENGVWCIGNFFYKLA